jgi:hypothetical protein
MRPARNIWMASDREDADLARIRIVRKLPVKIIEVIPPNVFNISRIYPPMAIGTVLDEHHRWEIILDPLVIILSKFKNKFECLQYTSFQGSRQGRFPCL